MRERTTDTVGPPHESAKDVLTEILREGARKMLATAIEAEVDAYIDEHAGQRDASGDQRYGGHMDVTIHRTRMTTKHTDATTCNALRMVRNTSYLCQ